MGRKKRGNGRLLEVGEHALVAAVFELALRDVEKGNGHSEEAREFLEGPRGAFWMRLVGVRPEYFRRLLAMPDGTYAGELEERLVWMLEVEGFTREEAGFEVWGEMSKHHIRRVADMVGNKYVR